MENLETVLNWALGAAGAVVLASNALKAILGWTAPMKELKRRVDRHDELLATDKKRLDLMDEDMKMLLNLQLVMLENAITGNSIEKLKHAKEELTKYLVGRGK